MAEADRPYVVAARVFLVATLAAYMLAVRAGSRLRARTRGGGMTLAGWIFLGLAWGLVLSLAGYCVTRILRGD